MAGQRCFVGLGSNIGDGPGIIHRAVEGLANVDDIKVRRVSSLYRSAAWGNTNQPDFTNAVVEVETRLAAAEMLRALLQLERKLGRSRDTGHWGPRRIDLDLLTYGEERINEPGLTVPHPHMHQRAFVLVPLLELSPGFEIPGLGSALEWSKRLQDQLVERLEPQKH